MKLKKSETNNAIITTLANVRPHSNADRLKLATVLGTQVIVDLEAEDGDDVVYFDSNLRLSHDYLFWNNLYAKSEMNSDPKAKPGFFGKSGRVKAQRFRGEVSNGLAVHINTLVNIPEVAGGLFEFTDGDEFTHINDVEICSKYFVEPKGGSNIATDKKKKKSRVSSNMVWKMWKTRHLMRELHQLVPGVLFVEEKIHGTSGRTAHALYHRKRRWYQLWKPKYTRFWKVVSGTRRVDGLKGYMKVERRIIHNNLAPHVHKGEELFYEIYGYELNGKCIQKIHGGGGFSYGCVYHPPRAWDDPNESYPFKVMLYRVTITTEDGYRIDLSREQVYRRAEELGLEKPYLIRKCQYSLGYGDIPLEVHLDTIMGDAQGQSHLDDNTLLEGVVVWFKNCAGNWSCLKHKSEEFLMLDSRNKDKGIGDVEDEL